MPELPEVEIAARSLAAQVNGATITAIAHLDWERMVETPLSEFYHELVGRQIRRVGRRAKWIMIELDADWTLAVHLRMSGILLVEAAGSPRDPHTHLVLELHDGRQIAFNDQRKFGRVRLLDPQRRAVLDAEHGPEPLESGFTVEVLTQILAKRSTKIKPLLLDQHLIAGLGNIYVSEALWLAQIHPLTRASDVRPDAIPALHMAIRHVLEKAIANQGSTLRNYRNGYGQSGTMQDHFFVYDRAEQPCERCGSVIERIVVAQRSTYYCPSCQQQLSEQPGQLSV